MALKAVHVTDVPSLDQIPETQTLPLHPKGVLAVKAAGGFIVVGHRGKGMNALTSADRRLMAVKENSLRSFNQAGRFPIDFIEFDVQVTKDNIPIIFHDNHILTEEAGIITEKQVTDLYLEEFLSYGPQREVGKVGKSLLRKAKDGRVLSWIVEVDDSLCTLQEAFQRVDSHLGFNIELKFDDYVVYQEEKLSRALHAILQVVFNHANERPVIFSSFQPDAAQLMRKLQSIYPVLFLTNGGTEIFSDARRNSLDEAIKLCLASGLQGIVSEVKGIFKNPSAVPIIKESSLALLTYGQLNNVPEAVYMQHLMGINGVIVDLVEEITVAVSDFIRPAISRDESLRVSSVQDEEKKEEEKEVIVDCTRPRFSVRELSLSSFLVRLIPELVEH